MANKTVLVIAYYYPPLGLSGVQRTTKFVKYLTEYGWDPIVLTTDAPPFYAYDESLAEELEQRNIKVYRTKPKKGKKQEEKTKTIKFPNYFKQKLGRAVIQTLFLPDRRILWKNRAMIIGDKVFRKHKVDAIFATAPPWTDFLIANELSLKYEVPFIVDYRDVWIDNPFHLFPTPFHKNYCVKLENDILNHAGKVVVTTRHTKELLVKRYGFLSYDDVAIISHGYDEDDFEPFKEVKPDPAKFTITHSGLFQDNRTPKYFFKALSNFLKSNQEAAGKVEARFIGLMRPGHYKYIKKFGLEKNVKFEGYLSHPEVIKNLMESDVLWMMLNDDVRSPGKLYEYIGARKPILISAPDGIMRKTALDTKAAIATGPKDLKAIEKAIETFFNLWKKTNLPQPDEKYVREFNRRELTKSLARELELITEM